MTIQRSLFDSTPADLYLFERQARTRGYTAIAGIDEAGRGPLAGPVVAAAVVLHPDRPVDGVYDSKQLTEKRREQLYEHIMDRAASVGVGLSDAATVDRINILQATRQAMLEAVQALRVAPDCLLIDGITTIATTLPQQTIKKGDSRSASIAAASIIAKVTRDRIMCEYDKQYPLYGFAGHKGYGSKSHLAALLLYGPCLIHRLTFNGVAVKKR